MKVFGKFLGLAAAVMVLSGCGTLHLNHIVTGTECPTKEDCIKDLALDKQPANPDITFVVEPLLMNEKAKSSIGIPAFNSPVHYGNVELCAAKALRTEFKNARIVFDEKDTKTPFVRIKLKKIVKQAFSFGKVYMRIDYAITVNGKTIEHFAKTRGKVYWSSRTAASQEYPLVCAILARQVREIMDGKPVDQLTNEVKEEGQ